MKEQHLNQITGKVFSTLYFFCRNSHFFDVSLKKITGFCCLNILLFPFFTWSIETKDIAQDDITQCEESLKSDQHTQKTPLKRREYIPLHEVTQLDLKRFIRESDPTLEQIQNMTTTEVEEMTLDEVRQLKKYHLRVFSFEQLQALKREHILVLSVDQLMAFTLRQILYGLTRDHINVMTPEQKAVIESKIITSQQRKLFQLKLLPSEEMRKMGRAHIQALTHEKLKVLDITDFSPEQISYLTVEQAQMLIHEKRPLTTDQVNALGDDQMPEIVFERTRALNNIEETTPEEISRLNIHDIRRLTLRELRLLNREQLEALKPYQLGNMTFKQKLLGLTRAQTQTLNEFRKEVMTKGDWTHKQRQILNMKFLSLEEVQEMSSTRIQLLSPEELWVLNAWELTTEQLQALTGRQIRFLSPLWLQELTRKQAQSFTYDQIQEMTHDQTHIILRFLSPKQIPYLTFAHIMFFHWEEIQMLNQKQIQALTTEQIQRLNIGVLTMEQTRYLTVPQIKNLTDFQLMLMTRDQKNALTSKQKRALSPKQKRTLKRKFSNPPQHIQRPAYMKPNYRHR